MKRSVGVVLGFAVCAVWAWAQVPNIPDYQSAPQDLPREVGPQPIAFSHKAHAAKNIQCVVCHKGVEKKWVAGLPDLNDCMVCHQSVATDREAVQKLIQLTNLGVKKVNWVRIYDLPDFVFFSHKQHVKADVTCRECHGPVETREVLAQDMSINMISCMKCHAERGASNECFLCHDLGQ